MPGYSVVSLVGPSWGRRLGSTGVRTRVGALVVCQQRQEARSVVLPPLVAPILVPSLRDNVVFCRTKRYASDTSYNH